MSHAGDPAPLRRNDPLINRLEAVSALGVVAVLALLLSAAAFVRPAQTTAERAIDYTSTASFAYSADTAADSIYGSDGLESGAPVILDEVSDLDVDVTYRLTSEGNDVQVAGDAVLTATVTTSEGLRRSFPVTSRTVTRPESVLRGTLPLGLLRDFYDESTDLLGLTGGANPATLTLAATFDVRGRIAGRVVQTSFDPSVDLLLDGDSLTVDSESGETVEADDPVLNPTDDGQVTYTEAEPATFSLLVIRPSVNAVRWVALAVGLAALVACLVVARRLRGASGADETETILASHGSRIVTTTALDLHEGPVVDLAWMQDLVELAKRYESTVLHVPDPDGDQFLVWDNGLTYRYRAAARATSASTDALDSSAPGRS